VELYRRALPGRKSNRLGCLSTLCANLAQYFLSRSRDKNSALHIKEPETLARLSRIEPTRIESVFSDLLPIYPSSTGVSARISEATLRQSHQRLNLQIRIILSRERRSLSLFRNVLERSIILSLCLISPVGEKHKTKRREIIDNWRFAIV